MKSLAFGVAIAFLALQPAHAASQARPHRLFHVSTVADSGSLQKDGSVWFKGWDEGGRFVLPPTDEQTSQRLWNVLQESNAESRSIDIEFDVGRANFNAETGTIDFPLCSVRLDEIVINRSPACGDTPISPDRLSSAGKISLGWAEAHGGSAQVAAALLDSALLDPKIPTGLQTVALSARAAANETIAYDAQPQSEMADRALILALADNRQVAKLDPTNVEHRLAEAADLFALGDYDAAAQSYDNILKEWPDENYRITVRRAALARIRGENQHSLDLLNSLVASTTGDLGMKFYYHRGWTLLKLERFEEAIADLTAGMKSQPDYASAYLVRGCSYASVGQLDYAASDFDFATSLYQALPKTRSSDRLQQDIALAKSTAESLRRKIAEGQAGPVKGLCKPFLKAFDQTRPRSRLLVTQLTSRN